MAEEATELAYQRRPKITNARIVIVETATVVPMAGSPQQTVSRFSRPLTTDEQPYVRQLKITDAWTPLDTGWFAGQPCGMMLLANQEKDREAVVEMLLTDCPTPSAGKWRPEWLVLPGESMRGCPCDLSVVRLRCRKGIALVTLTLYPL